MRRKAGGRGSGERDLPYHASTGRSAALLADLPFPARSFHLSALQRVLVAQGTGALNIRIYSWRKFIQKEAANKPL